MLEAFCFERDWLRPALGDAAKYRSSSYRPGSTELSLPRSVKIDGGNRMKLENTYRLHSRELELEHLRWFQRRGRARQRNSTCIY